MQRFSNISKILCGFAAISLIGTPGTAPLEAQSRQGKRPDLVRIPPPSPVNCSIFARNDRDRMMVTGSKKIRVGQLRNATTSAASPPPPPPPAVSPVRQSIAGGALARQNRITRPGPYPYPYPRPQQPQDREKYAGEEVASIKRVAEEPVSTFAVDVDTGSYSNVRRFLNDGKMPYGLKR